MATFLVDKYVLYSFVALFHLWAMDIANGTGENPQLIMQF